MSSKYTIHTVSVPHRFKPPAKSGVIAWEEGCLRCAVCVKDQCIYDVYKKRNLSGREMVDSLDNQCMSCFSCVQNCPKELIHKSINPEYMAMGDTYWSPDIIARLWYQAESGRIPVSGAGYGGMFSGPGFDSMWTDMSEIVRPTRDGIHGREYISTAVDLGGKQDFVRFNSKGDMEENLNLVNIPVPIILRMPSFGSISDKNILGWLMAARRLGTLFAMPVSRITDEMKDYYDCIIPVILPNDSINKTEAPFRMIEIMDCDQIGIRISDLSLVYPDALISVILPMQKGFETRAMEILESGCTIINIAAADTGRARDNSCFLKDGIRSVHTLLVEKGVRDNVTLLASGGIAMAEHVAKSIICGADGVYADLPILIALECRMCHRCEQDLSCPVEIESASPEWTGLRTLNLIGAWHNQLLEVMGAMGIRDIRRLRGEVGRAMFFDELDRDIFSNLGRLEEGYELE